MDRLEHDLTIAMLQPLLQMFKTLMAAEYAAGKTRADLEAVLKIGEAMWRDKLDPEQLALVIGELRAAAAPHDAPARVQ